MISGGLIGGGETTAAPPAAPQPGVTAGPSGFGVNGPISEAKMGEFLGNTKLSNFLDFETTKLWVGAGQGFIKDAFSFVTAILHFNTQNKLIDKKAEVENHVLDNQAKLGEKYLEFAEASDERLHGANSYEVRKEQVRANAAVRMKEMELASQERTALLGGDGALDREMFGRRRYPSGSPVGLG